MSRLVITTELLGTIKKSLFKDESESAAALFGRAIAKNGQLIKIVVRELVEPEPSMFDNRTPTSVQLNPQFIAKIAQRAKQSGESVVFVHTHPRPFNKFSAVDDEGEEKLAAFLKLRTPKTIHASLLLTPEKSIARILGSKEELRVLGIGTELMFDTGVLSKHIGPEYDRQIKAFGLRGQKKIQSLKIGIVGLGGTGSVVAQQLAHLGVKNFLLIDPDILEESNLNRVVGATKNDVNTPKVVIAKRLIKSINPAAEVEIIQDSVLKNAIAECLIDTDFSFSCTDSHGSRAVINQLAYQYLLPVIDMGVVITTQNQKVERIAARTQLLSPGVACMVCGNLLDYEEVRRDLLTEFERKNDPYIIDAHESAPAVISLNSTIGSMAVTMFLNCVAGIPGNARLINYDAIQGTARPAFCSMHPTCVVCSMNGSLARGNEWPLPGRLD